MKWRLSHLAIIELVVTVILVVITIVMVRSSYKTYYLQSHLSDALKYYHSGPKYFEEALKVLDKAQATDPYYGPTYNLFGAIFAHPAKMRVKQAKINYEKALELCKNPRDQYIARLALGIIALYRAEEQKDKTKKRDLYTRAEEFLDKAGQVAKGSPDGSIYRWILLSIQNQSGKSKGSLREIQELLKETTSPDNLPNRSTLVSFYYQRARESVGEGELFKACDFLRRAFRLDTRNEAIPALLASVLEMLLERGFDEENTFEKKLGDILFVENTIFLIIGNRTNPQRQSLLGLNSYLSLLTGKLGYAYGRLGDRAAKKFGWLKDVTGLNIDLAKKLSKMRCTRADQMIQRGLKFLKEALNHNRVNRKVETVEHSFCLFYQAKVLEIWIHHNPSQNSSSIYEELKKAYQQIGDLTFLNSVVRRNAYSNVGYCYGKVRDPRQARVYAEKALSIDRSDPRPYINAAVFMDGTPNRHLKAIELYQKVLSIFDENIAKKKKYSDHVMELKEKVALRLKALKKKYKIR